MLILVFFIDTWLGISAYGATNTSWPVKKWLSCYPAGIQRPAVSVLYGTFGESTRALAAFTKHFSDRPHLIELHISNECARRKRRSGGQILSRLSVSQYEKAIIDGSAKKAVEKRVDEIFKWIDPVITENTHLWLTTGLEHNLSAKAAKKLHRWVDARAAVLSVIVDNPMTNRPNSGLITETHGRSVMGKIWNTDGVSVDFEDGEKFFERMTPYSVLETVGIVDLDAVFLWSASQQGLRGIDDWNHNRPYDKRDWIFTPQACRGMRKLLGELGK